MSKEVAFLVLHYGGEFINLDEFLPNYICGKNHPIQVSSDTTFEDIKNTILLSLIYDSMKFNINLVCHFSMDDGYIATSITNDGVNEVVLKMSCFKPLVVYVEICLSLDHDPMTINIMS